MGNAVNACLGFIATEKEAVVAAAKQRFSSLETLDVTLPAPPPVDWALAVQRLAAWPRRGGRIAVATHLQPTLLASPGNETKEPSPPSRSPPQGFECSRQCCGLPRAADDKRGAVTVVERSTQCPGEETEDDDITVHNHHTTIRRRKQVPCRHLRCALESSPRLRSEPRQTPPTTSPLSTSPLPPPWTRAACVEPTVACFGDGAADRRGAAWRERNCPTNVEPCAAAEAGCRRQAAHRRAAASPGGCSVRGETDGEKRNSSSESDGGVGQQVSFEKDGRDDDRSELSVDGIPRDLQNHEPTRSGGSGGDDFGERRCCRRVSGDVDNGHCRNDRDFTRAFRAPEASSPRTMFPSRAATRTTDDAVQPATLRTASIRVRKQSPRHPPEQWPFARFESDPSSDRHTTSEEHTSQRRHSTGYDDDEDDSGDDSGGDVEAVHPGPRECDIKSSLRAADVSLMPEAREEANGDDGEQDAESSCALARKRALLRVRLARQRHDLATAVLDANERGLRAERRRRREEKLAALLINARRDSDVGVGYGGCADNQSARGRQLGRERCYSRESGERGGAVGYSSGRFTSGCEQGKRIILDFLGVK